MNLNGISLAALFACAPVLAVNRSNQEALGVLEHNAAQAADAVAMIEYRVVLYKDRTEKGHDAQAWKSLVQKTTKSLRAVNEAGDWASAVAEVFKIARAQDQNGIYGEISVSMSDGNTGACCGEQCCCIDRYKGNCPCSLTKEQCASRGDNGDLDDDADEAYVAWPDGDEFVLEDEDGDEVTGESCSACHTLIPK